MIEPLTETEKAYLAGFFDGEGCVHISKTKPRGNQISPEYKMAVVFCQAEESCLRHWMNRTGLGRIYLGSHKPGTEDSRGVRTTRWFYHWRMSAREAETILRLMLPYLVIKKDQAELALKFRAIQQTYACKYGVSPAVMNQREEYRLALMALKNKDQEGEPEILPMIEPCAAQLDMPGF